MKQNENDLNRRDFMVTTSLGVAGLALSNSVHAAANASPALPLSIGFAAATARSFQAAESMLNGDPTLFSTGAQFSMRGIQRSSGERLNVTADVLYPMADGSRVPFFALTHTENKKVAGNSNPPAFFVPVPVEGTVDLSIKTTRSSGQEAAATVSFAVNPAPHALKLNQGAYIFALSDKAVDWSSVRLASGCEPSSFISGGKPLLVRGDGRSVDFDYIVMTVGAAKADR